MSAVTSFWLLEDLTGLDGLQLDAYEQWDLITGFARHDVANFTQLPVLMEFAPGQGRTQLRALEAAGAEVQAALQRLADALALSCTLAPDSVIHTAFVPRDDIPALRAALQGGVLRRYTLGAPCDPAQARAAPAAAGAAAALAVQPTSMTLPSAERTLQTVGLVDDGCCFAHEAFRTGGRDDATGSRLLALWVQEPLQQPDGPWRRYPVADDGTVPYGVELAAPDIEALLRRHPRLGERSERALYEELNRTHWGMPMHTHGARVMHLLAGEPRRRADGSDVTALVPELPIIFVQLPLQTVQDTSGDSLGLHVVDGARYIVHRTKQSCQPGQAWATTICISLGSIAGPHDGTSMAEMALAELARRPPPAVQLQAAALPQVNIVVAAGNSGHGQRVHASQLAGAGETAGFDVAVAPLGERDSFVEVWLPDAGFAAQAQVTVQPPGGGAPCTVSAGRRACWWQDGAVVATLVFAHRVAQGNVGTMALLCIAPTRPRGARRAAAPAGVWHIDVAVPRDTTPQRVHAWVERDDIIIGRRRRQQTRFLPASASDPVVNDESTLSSLAHVASDAEVDFHVAAAYVDAPAPAYVVVPYTGRGPLRDGRQPRVAYAPSESSTGLVGLRVPGFYSGSSARLNGTSAAAPQVARQLAGRMRDQLAQGGYRPPPSSRKPPAPTPPAPDVSSDLRPAVGDPRTIPSSELLVPGTGG